MVDMKADQSQKNKINIKIRYDLQDTERVVCKCAVCK